MLRAEKCVREEEGDTLFKVLFFFVIIRRPPRSTQSRSSAASDVYKRQGLGEPLDTLTRDNYQFEKHVVGAEWDDAGFWAPDSVRNFIYYVASGFAGPLLLGLSLIHISEPTRPY